MHHDFLASFHPPAGEGEGCLVGDAFNQIGFWNCFRPVVLKILFEDGLDFIVGERDVVIRDFFPGGGFGDLVHFLVARDTAVARDPFEVDGVALVLDADKCMANITDYFMLGKRFRDCLDSTETVTKDAGAKGLDFFYPFKSKKDSEQFSREDRNAIIKPIAFGVVDLGDVYSTPHRVIREVKSAISVYVKRIQPSAIYSFHRSTSFFLRKGICVMFDVR